MYRRQPSGASYNTAVVSHSVVRRCSGQARSLLDPGTGGVTDDSSFEVGDQHPDYEENLPVRRHPTVLLVKSSRHSSGRFVSGPLLPSFSALTTQSSKQTTTHIVMTHNSTNSRLASTSSSDSISQPQSSRPMAAVLVGPELLTITQQDSKKSGNCDVTTASSINYLSSSLGSPSHSTTSTSNNPSVSSVLMTIPTGHDSQYTNPLEQHFSLSSVSSPADGITQSRRLSDDSEYSFISSTSAVSTEFQTAVDSGRTYLIAALKTTDRFTHRWPKPYALRTVSVIQSAYSCLPKSSSRSEIALLDAERGSDIGVIPDEPKWTMHKWWLLASVICVFICGKVCLVCAILTWIQGQFYHSYIICEHYSS